MSIFNRKGWYIFWIIWSFAFMVWDIVNSIRYSVLGNTANAVLDFVLAAIMLAFGILWVRMYQDKARRGTFTRR